MVQTREQKLQHHKTWIKTQVENNPNYYHEQYMKYVSEISEKNHFKHLSLKARLYFILKPICVSCEITDLDVLNFDHINNDGYQDKKKFGSNTMMYRYYADHLKEAKLKLQVLCANCNHKKKMYFLAFRRLEKINLPPF